jgi:RNA polymerase sigma factor (sigma-70 family)
MSVHVPFDAGNAEQEFAAIYEEHYDLLVGIAVDRFGISHADAETLVQEVFLELLLHAGRVRDRRAWLIGAIYNASKSHLRRAQRVEPLPEHGLDPADPRYARVEEQWPAELAAREAFARLTPRCQLALRLRFIEGHTVPSIASLLGTTARYAAKLVSRCLQLAHRRYSEGTSR